MLMGILFSRAHISDAGSRDITAIRHLAFVVGASHDLLVYQMYFFARRTIVSKISIIQPRPRTASTLTPGTIERLDIALLHELSTSHESRSGFCR